MKVKSMYRGNLIRFSAVDSETDSGVISSWTQPPDEMGTNEFPPLLPLSKEQVKKILQETEKESPGQIYFSVRLLEDDRLIGLVGLSNLDWSNGAGILNIKTDPDTMAYPGRLDEILFLLLRYAFKEINLFRVGVITPEYTARLADALVRNGFSMEVRRREALYHHGCRWDILMFGITHDDWISTVQDKEMEEDGPITVSG